MDQHLREQSLKSAAQLEKADDNTRRATDVDVNSGNTSLTTLAQETWQY